MLSPRAWREELRFDHQQMGVHVGLRERSARYTWKNYETGIRVPTVDILARCETMSGGRVTAASWLAVTMGLRQIPPGRLYGTRLQTRMADAARA